MGSNYKSFYYPAISYCYAYTPTNKSDMKPEYGVHNWFLPSAGDIVRLGFFAHEYKNPNNSNDTVNEFNIFKKAIDKGIMKQFSAGAHYATSSENGTQAQYFCVYHNTYRYWYPVSQDKRAFDRNVRPISVF